MDSNHRFQLPILLSLLLSLIIFSAFSAHAESEAYRRQAKLEIERANDFHRFQKFLAEHERQKMSGVSDYKADRVRGQVVYENARKEFSEWVKREEAKKPTDEFVERQLASIAEKDEREKELVRKEFRAVQAEVERAIVNSRLDENEEYGLEEFNFAQ